MLRNPYPDPVYGSIHGHGSGGGFGRGGYGDAAASSSSSMQNSDVRAELLRLTGPEGPPTLTLEAAKLESARTDMVNYVKMNANTFAGVSVDKSVYAGAQRRLFDDASAELSANTFRDHGLGYITCASARKALKADVECHFRVMASAPARNNSDDIALAKSRLANALHGETHKELAASTIAHETALRGMRESWKLVVANAAHRKLPEWSISPNDLRGTTLRHPVHAATGETSLPPGGSYAGGFQVATPSQSLVNNLITYFGIPMGNYQDPGHTTPRSADGYPAMFSGFQAQETAIMFNGILDCSVEFQGENALPWYVITSPGRVVMNQLVFNDHTLDRTSYQAHSRVVTYRRMMFDFGVVLWTLGQAMALNVFSTDEGKMIWSYGQAQIEAATRRTFCQQAAVAIFHSISPARTTVSLGRTAMTLQAFKNAAAEEFATADMVRRTDRAYVEMITKMERRLEASNVQSKASERALFVSGFIFDHLRSAALSNQVFLQGDGIARDMIVQSPALVGVATVTPVRPFLLGAGSGIGTQGPIDVSKAINVSGHFGVVDGKHPSQEARSADASDHFQTKLLDVRFYCRATDRHRVMAYEFAFWASGLFDRKYELSDAERKVPSASSSDEGTGDWLTVLRVPAAVPAAPDVPTHPVLINWYNSLGAVGRFVFDKTFSANGKLIKRSPEEAKRAAASVVADITKKASSGGAMTSTQILNNYHVTAGTWYSSDQLETMTSAAMRARKSNLSFLEQLQPFVLPPLNQAEILAYAEETKRGGESEQRAHLRRCVLTPGFFRFCLRNNIPVLAGALDMTPETMFECYGAAMTVRGCGRTYVGLPKYYLDIGAKEMRAEFEIHGKANVEHPERIVVIPNLLYGPYVRGDTASESGIHNWSLPPRPGQKMVSEHFIMFLPPQFPVTELPTLLDMFGQFNPALVSDHQEFQFPTAPIYAELLGYQMNWRQPHSHISVTTTNLAAHLEGLRAPPQRNTVMTRNLQWGQLSAKTPGVFTETHANEGVHGHALKPGYLSGGRYTTPALLPTFGVEVASGSVRP